MLEKNRVEFTEFVNENEGKFELHSYLTHLFTQSSNYVPEQTENELAV
ncbi:hypothetical protein MZM54_03825 [[Brevibacterium] frigoritolerans]|nr:hypothetical protein [Peribacillus frigoritolerans]